MKTFGQTRWNLLAAITFLAFAPLRLDAGGNSQQSVDQRVDQLTRLINAIHDDVLAAAMDLARTLVAGPPHALAGAKLLVDAGGEMPLAEGIAFERRTVSALFDSADRVEGIAAFVAKRPPVFTGH